MRISDWSSDVCSSDLIGLAFGFNDAVGLAHEFLTREQQIVDMRLFEANDDRGDTCAKTDQDSRNNAEPGDLPEEPEKHPCSDRASRSEEHPSELQSLMRISYAVFCLKKKN